MYERTDWKQAIDKATKANRKPRLYTRAIAEKVLHKRKRKNNEILTEDTANVPPIISSEGTKDHLENNTTTGEPTPEIQNAASTESTKVDPENNDEPTDASKASTPIEDPVNDSDFINDDLIENYPKVENVTQATKQNRKIIKMTNPQTKPKDSDKRKMNVKSNFKWGG